MRNRMLNAERHACRFQAAIGPSIAPGARRLKRDVALWRQSPRQTKSNPFFETLVSDPGFRHFSFLYLFTIFSTSVLFIFDNKNDFSCYLGAKLTKSFLSINLRWVRGSPFTKERSKLTSFFQQKIYHYPSFQN